MTIKNKKKCDIQKIFIQKDYYENGCIVSFVCNDQFIELSVKSNYIDDIFFRINEYLNIIYDDNNTYHKI